MDCLQDWHDVRYLFLGFKTLGKMACGEALLPWRSLDLWPAHSDEKCYLQDVLYKFLFSSTNSMIVHFSIIFELPVSMVSADRRKDVALNWEKWRNPNRQAIQIVVLRGWSP